MNKKIVAIGLLLLVLAAATAYKLYHREAETMTATGTIEVTRVDISPKVGGQLVELLVKEGDSVQAGQKVARVSRPDLDAQLLRDEAAYKRAEIQLTDLQKGARLQEREDALASVVSAQVLYEKAQSDYQRYAELFAKGAISAQQLESSKAGRDVAYQTYIAAQSRQGMVEEGNRIDVVDAQRLEVERNKAIVEASRTVVNDTIVISPGVGTVVSKNVEAGEYVNPGNPIITVVKLSECWVKVYIASTQLGQISLNQEVQVKVDSYPERIFHGVISEISQTAEFTPRQSLTQRERANMVFGVKVRVDNPDGILKAGMPADVRIP